MFVGISFPGEAKGVTIEGTAETNQNGAPEEEELEPDVMADDDDDEDLDLFGEMTEEEKAAAEEKKKAIEAKKAKAKANALKAKSMIIIDVKPWDDTTGHVHLLMFVHHMLQIWPSWRRRCVVQKRMVFFGVNVIDSTKNIDYHVCCSQACACWIWNQEASDHSCY